MRWIWGAFEIVRCIILLVSLALVAGCKTTAPVDTSERAEPATPAAKPFDPPTPMGAEADAAADELADLFPIEVDALPGLGFGRGSSKARVDAIRQALLAYDGTFIRGCRSVLGDPDVPAVEVHAALVELMATITGPAGLWRKTVPMQWLGCAHNGDTPPCVAFARAATHFGKWDRFQSRLDRAPVNPGRFLAKSHAKILQYTATYVPEDRSFSAARKTPFWQEHLEDALQSQE